MNSNKIPTKILYLRIRNRIIEVLKVIADPALHEWFGGDEILCMWEDWVDDRKISEYTDPEFSKEEQTAILEFHEVWVRACENTPQVMPPIRALKNNTYWLQLIEQARKALIILSIRGGLNEESDPVISHYIDDVCTKKSEIGNVLVPPREITSTEIKDL
ncbi:hypothetical protein [Sessilibacter corallicola]|uniref:hypothetical protein n=1 Tax=Sessilibacter corallicola TaxID=2904075 RepID=UPI001E42CBE1|nr:hypothetical protein [Sessilibacter corallicola]MCE2029465.1 hypothetical protein [Sessilibacter corallicola]